MKRISALLASAFTMALPALAEPVVVELFASQNCAACPKAFKTLKTVSETEDILVLTWSVDYWDYLADKDPMAMPESKERQAAYVERFGLRGPYTPQTVYDGAAQCPGNSKRRVKRQLSKRQDQQTMGVTLQAANGGVSLAGQLDAAADVVLVHYLPDYKGDMPNPVTKVETLGQWAGGDVTYPVSCDNGCAVLVQDPGVGEIHGAQVMP